jgi:uncharacterized integral membrane protein
MTNPIDQPAPGGPPFPPGQPPVTGPAGAPPPNQPRPAEPPSAANPVSPTTPVPAAGFDGKGRVRRTRVSGVWVGLIAAAVFLILLVVFIAQNSRRVPIHFFGWHGNFSLALTILVSAIVGVLLVALPGSVRILQLRRALRKNVPGGTQPTKSKPKTD